MLNGDANGKRSIGTVKRGNKKCATSFCNIAAKRVE